MTELQITITVAFAIIVVICLAVTILKSPFHYPYYYNKFNVTGKRNPSIDDLLDEYMISHGFGSFESHQNYVTDQWKQKCEQKIERSWLKSLRRHQYENCLDDRTFVFTLVRTQTRYKQVNYQKHAYTVDNVIATYTYTFKDLKSRYDNLSAINFETTISKYNQTNQRKLMTKELRKKIMLRDNYTCRNCGKQMFDGVGLHIDHIIPIAKGGKTVESNLQVLCSKCNGRKSSKMQ